MFIPKKGYWHTEISSMAVHVVSVMRVHKDPDIIKVKLRLLDKLNGSAYGAPRDYKWYNLSISRIQHWKRFKPKL